MDKNRYSIRRVMSNFYKLFNSFIIFILIAMFLCPYGLSESNPLSRIRGIAYGGIPPGFDYGDLNKLPFTTIQNDLKTLQSLGFNCIRVYDILPDDAYTLADTMGLNIIQQMGYPGTWTKFNDPNEINNYLITIRQKMKSVSSHPSIILWCAWNDLPFNDQFIDQYGEKTIGKALSAFVTEIKSNDPFNRPVTGASMPGFKYTEIGMPLLDMIGFNYYIGTQNMNSFTEAQCLSDIAYLEKISEKYHKPLLILEFGFSSYHSSPDQLHVVQNQLFFLKNLFAGFVLFEWADEWFKAGNPQNQDDHPEEFFGIVSAFRKPKPVFNIIKELNLSDY